MTATLGPRSPPGSVNLIGEHTDYYDDFVPIPMVFLMVSVMVARTPHDDSGICCALQVATDASRMLVRNTLLNTVVIPRPGNHYSCHRNGHRDKHEALVVVGMFTKEVDASLGCHVNRRREMRDCLLPRQFSMVEKGMFTLSSNCMLRPV